MGTERIGAKRANAASGDNAGSGELPKLVESTTPSRLEGGSAAIASAIGPEKDSPSRTNGAVGGSVARTKVSSAE